MSPRLCIAALALCGVTATACFNAATILKEDAATRFKCPQEAITMTDADVGPRMKYVEGCGHKHLYVWTRHHWLSTAQLQNKAAFDLNCPREQLALVPLGADRNLQMGVTGCGRKASYTYVRISAYDAGWVTDVVGRPRKPSTPATQAAPTAARR